MNLEKFKPLLAVEADLETLRFPCYVSPKLDGYRCIAINGGAFSRSLKPIANRYVRKVFEDNFNSISGLDGELIVGSPTSATAFNITTSAIGSYDGEPDFKYYVFDRVAEGDYETRWMTSSLFGYPEWVVVVKQVLCHNLEELAKLEEKAVNAGYEGVMLRSPNGHYKFGRSTAREQILLKVKRFEDTELEVIGFEERMHNNNEATVNALGHTERSSHKDNMIGRGDLGALVCKFGEDTVKVGTGFDDAQRADIWNNRDKYLGNLAKIKHQPSGAKDKLRFPVFLGWRDINDL